ncbi:MAG: hypothetical protein KDA80_24470, partial [Planctomycetaceae bacterium]|nr:hypothetical protein [Planctomycetaceae bacterium]
MNHTWSRIRRNTIGVAVAVTCASGLPLAGCLKSSSRSFSTGLGGNAGRAAIEAERDIEEQKRQDALIAKQETSSDTNARILGPHERNIGTAAQSEDIGFASTAQVARKPESDAGNSGIQQVTGTETSQTENTVWESLVQEHLAQRPPEKKTQSEFENPFANWGTPPTNEPRSGVASPSQWPEDPWAEPQSRNLAFSSEVASDDLSAPTPEWARETQHVTSRQTDGKRSESRTIQPKRSVERLRVQALLSDAHSQKIRGELHSAYRSALLAERIAQQNGMEFPTEEEEDPAEFARELANQIWKSSEEPAPTKSAHQVTIQPRQPEHD